LPDTSADASSSRSQPTHAAGHPARLFNRFRTTLQIIQITSVVAECPRTPRASAWKRAWNVLLHPGLVLTILVLTQLAMTSVRLKETLRDPKRVDTFLQGDAGTYIGIGRRFAAGDFSMSWVRKRPHRVPLYPGCLAVALAVSGDNPAGFAVVNIVIACLLVTVVYLATLSLFGHRLVAALLGIACLANRFLFEFNTGRVMTEPLFVLMAVGTGYFFVTYVRRRRRRDLVFLALCGALAYLTRVNGLFLILATLGTLFAFEMLSLIRNPEAKRVNEAGRLILRYLLAALVVLIISAPNWWPRWHYFHNPIEDGYPTNYLWVDTWEQGTTGEPFASFSWRDYAATHTFHDMVARWKLGIYRVAMTIPIRTEKIGIPYWLAVAGIVIALWRRKTEFILLTVVMIGVLLPAMWTFLPTQVWRIPYSSFLPFEFLFAALALDFGITGVLGYWDGRRKT
jgi:hypothetical protein